MKEYFSNLVKPMIDYPDELKIEEIYTSTNGILLKVFANKKDIGKLIGKEGHNAKAIRTLCNAVAAKKRIKFLLELPY